jgi:transposase
MHIMSVAKQSVSRPRRRVHSDAFKRRLVELSMAPGASVSAIALEHGINANLLFGWRKAYLKSQAAARVDRSDDAIQAATLLPVEVASTSTPTATASLPACRGSSAPGTIEIELAGARVRLRGAVDEAGVRSVLAALRAIGA